MLKKIITIILISFLCIWNAFALDADNDAHEYKNNIIKWHDGKAIQAGLQDLNTSEINRIRKHFKIQWKAMSEADVKKYLSDGKYWPVTQYAQKMRANSAASAKELHNAVKKEQADAKKDWTLEEEKPKCGFDLWDGSAASKENGYAGDVRAAIEWCVGGSALVQVADARITGGFKTVVIGWVNKIAGFLALGAIFTIAFGSLRLTLSRGEEENIKKAKDIIKWWIIGFLWVVSAWFLIATVVNFIYWLAKVT